MGEAVKNLHIFGIQLSLVFAITFATQNVSPENCQYWMRKIARYVLYILIIKSSREASIIAYKKILYNTELSKELSRTVRENKRYIFIFTITSSILIYYDQVIFDEEFIWLFMAYLISQYPEICRQRVHITTTLVKTEPQMKSIRLMLKEELDKQAVAISEKVITINSRIGEKLKQLIDKNLKLTKEVESLKTKIQSLEKETKRHNNLHGIHENGIQSPPNGYNSDKPSMINYGVGMACSFFEGYLTQVIPSDGATFVGFQENITIFESNQNVVFPVKRLFIIITKSLYCPPNLHQFNKINRPDLPYLEACRAQKKVEESENTIDLPKSTTDSNEAITHAERRKKEKESLEDVVRDVAGVTNRTYRNSAYKIHRPHGAPLVYLAAECATPLHTLHKVLEKRALYDRLCDVDPQEIVADFCEQLQTIIARSPDCRNKCTLIHYDDTNPDENLADLLLKKIEEIEPKFEEIIISRQNAENDVGFNED